MNYTIYSDLPYLISEQTSNGIFSNSFKVNIIHCYMRNIYARDEINCN